MATPLLNRLSDQFAKGHSQPAGPLRDEADYSPDNLRAAAVLIAVTDRADPGVLLIHRPSHMRSHPGQAAFPGGKIDPGEEPIEAALREAEEELGIRAADVQIIGTTDRYRTGSGYDITPVLALVPPDLPIVPNPHEVASWFEPPLGFVLDRAHHARQSMMFGGQMRTYLEIYWHEHRIWGVTAGIIANLAQRLDWHGAGFGSD